jgi:hypothetical protein
MKTKPRYSLEEYDKHVCLKPDTEMWLVMIYLAHGFVIFMIYLVGVFRMKNGGFDYLGDINPLFVIGAIPAVLVIWAYFRRAPEESDKIKRIWVNGRSLLILSCMINMLQPIMIIVSSQTANFVSSALLAVDFVVLVYLVISTRVKDVFSEYPGKDI